MMSKYFVMMPNARIFPNDAPKNNDWHGCRVKLEKICKDQDRQGFLIHRTISLDRNDVSGYLEPADWHESLSVEGKASSKVLNRVCVHVAGSEMLCTKSQTMSQWKINPPCNEIAVNGHPDHSFLGIWR